MTNEELQKKNLDLSQHYFNAYRQLSEAIILSNHKDLVYILKDITEELVTKLEKHIQYLRES